MQESVLGIAWLDDSRVLRLPGQETVPTPSRDSVRAL